MKANMIEIKEFLLRIPGLGVEEAEKLGEDIAKRIADGLPPGVGSRYVSNLDLQLTPPAGASTCQLAELISAAIVKKMQ
jgi:hypothetical protein